MIRMGFLLIYAREGGRGGLEKPDNPPTSRAITD